MNYQIIAGEGIGIAEARTMSPENPAFNISDPAAWSGWLGGMQSLAGENVTHRKALTFSPVWQAISIIAGDVAKLPLEVWRKRKEGIGRDKVEAHPAHKLINLRGRANEEMLSFKMWQTSMVCALLWNHSFIWIERRGTRPVGLYPLCPDRTTLLRKSGKLWVVTEVNGSIVFLEYDDCIHISGPHLDLGGNDLVRQAREDIGVAFARRKFKSRFFSNGCHAGGILQAPPGADKEARDKMEKAITEKHGSADKAFKTLVMRDGFKWHTTMISPEQSQIVELEEADVRDVARWYNLAPSALGVRESKSYNSSESDKQDRYDTTLTPWLLTILTEAHNKLLTEPERNEGLVIDYDVNRLLWANSETLSTLTNAAVLSGVMLVDEARELLGKNPYPNGMGAKPYQPANVFIAGEEPDADDKGGGKLPPDPAADPPPVTPPKGYKKKKPAEKKSQIPNPQIPNSLDAHRQLLQSAIGRVIRRIGTHAERAAKDPTRLLEYRSRIFDEHGPVAAEILGEVLPACRSVASIEITADDLARQVLQRFVEGISGETPDIPAAIKLHEGSLARLAVEQIIHH